MEPLRTGRIITMISSAPRWWPLAAWCALPALPVAVSTAAADESSTAHEHPVAAALPAADPGEHDINATRREIDHIKIEFMLDPAITRGIHVGERFVAPAVFAQVRQPGRKGSVVARAVGVDAAERVMLRRLHARWSALEPGQASISATHRDRVTITVGAPSETQVRVEDGERTTLITIRADYEASTDVTRLAITQTPIAR